MTILTVSNLKGGSGKSTTAAALGATLAERGKTVLLVDLDSQSTLSRIFGIDAAGRSMAEVVGGSKPGALPMGNIIRPIKDGLDLAPADIRLSDAELGLTERMGREFVIRNLLTPLKQYDLIICDCPPGRGLMSLNGIVAAAAVIVPTLASAPDLWGLRELLNTLDQVRDAGLNQPELLGVVVTQFDGRTNAHKKALEVIKAAGLPVIGVVARSVRVQEAAAARQPITEFDPKGKPAQNYYSLSRKVETWLKKTM